MHVLQIVGDDLRGQLRQLVQDLKLDLNGGFSRCVRCNELLASATKDEVSGRVPPYVFSMHENFMECLECRRVYWRGTHWAAMLSALRQIYQEVG